MVQKTVLIGVNLCLNRKRFEKTKPIFVRKHQRKLLYERDLWQYIVMRGSEKTKPIEANCRPLAGNTA